jgi:hypothetical protein
MMANFVEEGLESIEETDEVVDVKSNDIVEETAQPEADALPEKYKGKSAKEIAQMHMEAEKLIGRQGSEVGQLRRIVDTYIQAQAKTKEQQTEETGEVDFYSDPQKAVEKAIENHPKIKAVESYNLEVQRANALNQLKTSHPDFADVVADGSFQTWVHSSPVRSELFVRADKHLDYQAADELLTLYKQISNRSKETVEAEKKARSQSIKAATTTVKSGSDEAPSKKIYRRSDIIELMQRNPDKYDAMQDEILKAYREGRVR